MQIATNATPTFAVFVSGQGQPVTFDPATARIRLDFFDAGGLARGGTSVAVQTVE